MRTLRKMKLHHCLSILDWIGWPLRLSWRALLQLVHHDLNCLLQLWVMAVDDLRRCLFDFDVWRHTDVFYYPAFLRCPDGKVRRREVAAIHQDRKTQNANQPAPGAFTDELTHAEFAPHPRQ